MVKRAAKKFLFVIISLTVGLASAFFITQAIGYYKISKEGNTQNEVPKTQPAPISETKTPEQTSFYFLKDPKIAPKISADAYIVGDLDTGEIILKKKEEQKYPIASVSKLMTALTATELPDDNDVAVVSKKALATYGQNGAFHLNEKIKISDILYPLLLESSNDAAEIIAEHFNRETFLQKMNQEAQRLSMPSTSFEDPSGLSPNNQSTARDLFSLAGYLKNNAPNVLKITQNKSYSNKKHFWYSTNQFLSDDGYLGGKSGYTDEAKQTVISNFSLPLSESGKRNVAIVLLRTPDRKKDVESILKFVKKNIYYGGEIDAKSNWVKTKEGMPEFAEPDYVNLAFLGDIMLDRGVKSSVRKNFNGDYSALFQNMGELNKNDIVFANLEGPASDQGEDKHNLYSFRMDPETIPALKGAGIDVLSISNNHIGDWGREAFEDTLSHLTENEILYSGGGANENNAEIPKIIEKNGMKIGYLAFSDKGPEWLTPTDTESGLLLTTNPNFDKIIQNASKQVDSLVVSFHFGEEYQTKHNTRQEYLAHKAVDDGAKLVIGAHPHVVEDFEVYKNSYIAYSLGNFIFDQKFSENTMQGMLLEIKLYKAGTMSVKKNIIKLNSVFQPQKPILGKEEKIKFAK
ncbi:MAG: CapA family protein [Patescibacteria group bacterium]